MEICGRDRNRKDDSTKQVVWPEPLIESTKKLDHLIIVIHGIGDMLETKNLSTNLLTLSESLMKVAQHQNSKLRILIRAVEWHSKMQDRWRSILHKAVPGYPQTPHHSLIRSTIQDYFGDIMLFGSPFWREMLIDEVYCQIESEVQAVWNAYGNNDNQNHPQSKGFSGKCSLFCHSLGSMIGWELIRKNKIPDGIILENVFCLGSPVAAYLSLEKNGLSEFKSTLVGNALEHSEHSHRRSRFPRFYNIFHPLDPTAFRWEPFLLWKDEDEEEDDENGMNAMIPRAVEIWQPREFGLIDKLMFWIDFVWALILQEHYEPPIERIALRESHLNFSKGLKMTRSALYLERLASVPSVPYPIPTHSLLWNALGSTCHSIQHALVSLFHRVNQSPTPHCREVDKDEAEGSLEKMHKVDREREIKKEENGVRCGGSSHVSSTGSAGSFVGYGAAAAGERGKSGKKRKKGMYEIEKSAKERLEKVDLALMSMNGRRFDYEVYSDVGRQPLWDQMATWHSINAHFTYWGSHEVAAFVLGRIAKHHDESERPIRWVDPYDKLGY